MSESDVFIAPDAGDWTDLGGGVKRRLLGHDKDLMMVEVAFEKGAVGAMHAHPHIQISYVASGAFEVTIGGRKSVLRAGDSFRVPANAMHGCVALEPGTLIDAFTPRREDFLG